ncbi:MAG: aspartyl protease family protein [Gammaproteobacteria bacterium]|nr:aspartyl protease family protein [Gammaproteobacteria bacterium]MCP5199990.1 aspartyl protease family protein [Gammaproteobacteria bacterium]
MPRAIHPLFPSLVLLLLPALAAAGEFDTRVPLERAASGNFYVEGVLNASVHSRFLVDTGSGLVTISAALLDALAATGRVERAGRVAARLANGKLQAVQLYRVEQFRLGEHCELGPVDVAVIPGSSANILGLNLLARAAPFAVHVTPPALALSDCALGGAELAAR